MKKLLAILITMTLAFGMVACGGSETKEPENEIINEEVEAEDVDIEEGEVVLDEEDIF